MIENVKNNKFFNTLADPVLIYVAILTSSIMYHYRDSLALAYGIAAYVIGWLLFRLFNFMGKHKIIGAISYIIVSYVSLSLMRVCQEKGAKNYPISFALWFFTPQDSLQYNKWYTLEIFIFFLLFMASVYYFFTRTQYRVFMTFLIMMIPFALYGKEYEEMPTGYIIALAVGYIVIMMYFRQLSDNKDVVVIDKSESWKSGIAFAAVFAIISSVIPKPEITADRTFLETMIRAEAFTDKLVEMLNVFRDTADGSQFRGQTNDTPLYYARSPQDLRLKSTTFSTYDYEHDSWKIGETDDNCYIMREKPFEIPMNAELCDAILYAAEADNNFAAEYNLTDYIGYKPVYPELRQISIFSSYQAGSRTPVPQGAYQLLDTSYNEEILLSRSGAVISSRGGERFKYNETFSYSYIPDGFFSDEKNKELINRIGSIKDYSGMLDTAYDIINSEILDNYEDSAETETLRHYMNVIEVNKLFNSFQYELLNYGNNERIYELAQQITAGLSSDYEKAEALEWYFINNGYNYDLGYRKAVGENAEDFLFRTKTGVCYEYATSMTLLARACGIPARYCEGFNMHTKNENSRSDDSYIITAKDAHGFPELYIKGYGWVTFEPTMTFADASQQKEERQASDMLSEIGVVIFGIALLALALIIAYPFISHKIFTLINTRKKPNEAVAKVIRRICRLYGVPVSCTADEAEKSVKNTSGADISATVVMFNRAEYGGAELTENEKIRAMEDYLSAYNALNEKKKQARREKHKK